MGCQRPDSLAYCERYGAIVEASEFGHIQYILEASGVSWVDLGHFGLLGRRGAFLGPSCDLFGLSWAALGIFEGDLQNAENAENATLSCKNAEEQPSSDCKSALGSFRLVEINILGL